MSTLQELLKQRAALAAQQAELEKTLQTLQSEERKATIAKIKTLMAEHGLSVEDLAGSPGAKASKAGKSAGADGRTGKTVAPKYRDTVGNTWSGRGLKPKWLTSAIEGGAKIEDFLIPTL